MRSQGSRSGRQDGLKGRKAARLAVLRCRKPGSVAVFPAGRKAGILFGMRCSSL
jgi:hypothetical protein